MKNFAAFVFAGLLIAALALTTFMLRPASAAATGPSASGHGFVLLPDTEGNTVRRQFSFNARQMPEWLHSGKGHTSQPVFRPEV